MYKVSFNNKNSSIFTLTVYDIQGKLKTATENISGTEVKINCSQWNAGIYLVQLRNSKGEAWTEKVVVQ